MKLVEGKLIKDPEQDQQTAGDADGKAWNINYRIDAIPSEVAKGNQKVILKHKGSFR